MAKSVQYTSAILDETDDARVNIPSVKLFLRTEDDNDAPLTGTDRYYLAITVQVEGDDGSVKSQTVVRQLAAVPTGILSNAEKLSLISIAKKAYNAARAVATND